MKQEFKLEKFVLVGDRGMITQKQIDVLHGADGIDWIGALRPGAIKKLIDNDAVEMGLFDERNLFEIKHPDFPGERLIACRNGDLAIRRAKKREKLIAATSKELEKVKQMVLKKRIWGKENIDSKVQGVLKKYKIGKYFKFNSNDNGFDYTLNENELIEEIKTKTKGNLTLFEKRLKRADCLIESIAWKLAKINQLTQKGILYGKGNIGVRVGKVINKYKVGKHFKLVIRDNDFQFEVNQEKVQKEAALDGLYFVRTSLSKEQMNTDETVRSYKLLSNVERAFRSFKTVDLMVRPIRHRTANRVRAHIFLCMLAYYVQWHMVEVWRPLLFADEEQEEKNSRDPVAPAKRSDSARKKIQSKKLEDGSVVYSFRGLLSHLAAIVRATCRCYDEKETFSSTFTMDTKRNKKQQEAIDLLNKIHL